MYYRGNGTLKDEDGYFQSRMCKCIQMRQSDTMWHHIDSFQSIHHQLNISPPRRGSNLNSNLHPCLYRSVVHIVTKSFRGELTNLFRDHLHRMKMLRRSRNAVRHYLYMKFWMGGDVNSVCGNDDDLVNEFLLCLLVVSNWGSRGVIARRRVFALCPLSAYDKMHVDMYRGEVMENGT